MLNFKAIQTAAQSILDESVQNRGELGAQFAVFRQGELVVNARAGYLDPERTQAVGERTIFPVYSTGKAIATTAALKLVAQGKLHLGMRVADLWPEFGVHGKEHVTVRHLLQHRSGICRRPHYDSIPQIADEDVMRARVAGHAAAFVPGTQTRYQTVNYGWLLGEIAQRADGRPFKQIIEAEVLNPLNLKSLFFGVPAGDLPRVATIVRGPEIATIPDNPPCWDYALDTIMNTDVIRQACLPGFNCIANAMDLARHAAALLDSERDHRLLSREMIREATVMNLAVDDPKPQSTAAWSTYGLGYAVRCPLGDSARIFGHAGYGGSEGIAVKHLDLGVGYTRNQMHGGSVVREKLYQLLGIL